MWDAWGIAWGDSWGTSWGHDAGGVPIEVDAATYYIVFARRQVRR